MKNATHYEKKIKTVLRGLSKRPDAPPENADPVQVLLRGVLEADTTAERAEAALEGLRREFVDPNELRVAPPKELVEAMGPDLPRAPEKAQAVRTALGAVFQRAHAVTMAYMAEMTKRDLRRHLGELGLEPYAAAYVTLMAFGGHAVAVDQTLVDCLKLDAYVHPESDVEDVQGFLERIVPQKDAVAAHNVLRERVAATLPRLAAQRRKAGRRAAEAARKKAAETKAATKAAKKAAKKVAKKAKAAKTTATKKRGKRSAAGGAGRKKATRRGAAASKGAKPKGAATRAAGSRKRASGGTSKRTRKR